MAVSKDLKIKGSRKEEWTFEKVREELDNLDQNNPDPLRIQEIRVWLSSEYSRLTDLLPALEKREAQKWLELKKETKSVSEVDIKIKLTDEYQERKLVSGRLKAIEKMMASTRSQLEAWNRESWGSY